MLYWQQISLVKGYLKWARGQKNAIVRLCFPFPWNSKDRYKTWHTMANTNLKNSHEHILTQTHPHTHMYEKENLKFQWSTTASAYHWGLIVWVNPGFRIFGICSGIHLGKHDLLRVLQTDLSLLPSSYCCCQLICPSPIFSYIHLYLSICITFIIFMCCSLQIRKKCYFEFWIECPELSNKNTTYNKCRIK